MLTATLRAQCLTELWNRPKLRNVIDIEKTVLEKGGGSVSVSVGVSVSVSECFYVYGNMLG